MLSVVIPAYNEASSLPRTVKELMATLDGYAEEYEIIIVDDGSKDSTGECAANLAEHHPGVTVLSYPENRGKGYALKHGFGHTRGDFILFMDANNIPPQQIPLFLSYPNGNNPDVIIGSKYHADSQTRICFSRRLLSKCYYLMVKVLFNMRITDSQVGLKCFRRQVLTSVLPRMRVNGYAFDIELLYTTHQLGYVIMEAPVDLAYDLNRNLLMRGVWKMFTDTLATFTRLRIIRDRSGD